jgi:Zn-finger nucleic acid-binding protein
MKCPKCQVDLSISDRQGVEIDFCPQCRGVWLDRGELDKIIERAARFNDRAGDDDPRRADQTGRGDHPGRDYDRDRDRNRDYDDDRYYKRRKSFWSEIFD